MRVSLLPRMLGILVALGLGVYYIGFVILGYHVGPTSYDVRVRVPQAAGLFPGSTVTYRGVQVGKVDTIQVGPNGVDLKLAIKNRFDHIPADSYANIRMLSALGEQYVDFAPGVPNPPTGGPGGTKTYLGGGNGAATGTATSDTGADTDTSQTDAVRAPHGPYLHQGSVVPISQTTTPIEIGKVLTSGKRFLGSLDTDSLHTVETLLANAFSGTGPDLQRLVDTGQDLTEALIKAKPGTRKLILDGRTVLDAANATSGDLRTYVRSFDRLSKQFAQSDPDLERLFTGGGPALTKIEHLITTQSGPFEQLMRGAGKAGAAFSANSAAVRNLFAVLPGAASKLGSIGRNGALAGSLRLNDGQPVCTYAHLPVPGAHRASGSPLSCATHNGLQMRGPKNAPGAHR